MNCPACAHENRSGAKFCEECGALFKRLCASCGAELRPAAKFCDECGTATGVAAAPRPAEPSGARKVVTIVFADLVGSTALHERLDPESARRFMEGYYAAMRGAVESHGGSVTQFLGDGVKAVFGIPRVAEDDAIRAVRAAVAMQESFRALADAQRDAVGKTGLRVAVNTGEVVSNDASEIIGDPVNVAARLQEQGRDGDVVIGEATERLVSGLVTLDLLGTFALKGRTEAVSAWRVTSLNRPVGAATTAFVGREDELARIQSVYDTAVDKPATALATLLGSPGLGKSRLIDELALRLGDGATVIRANCDAAGGASFAPLADALRALPDLGAAVSGSDAERTRILDGVRALLAGSPASPEETFFVVRRLLAALAAAKPVVLVIDDLHWAEPLLLDLVEHLVQWGSGVPLLVLVGARPELREIRSTLVTPGGLVSEVVTLAGLDAGAAMRLAANVIGAADLPASVAAKVLAASEGNPLFVGELVRMLVHEGALKREGDRWTAGTALAALEIPPTILALLAARIERLRPEERIVLERAAVIGRAFSRSAVSELLSRDMTDLDARLESLRRAELIERDSGWFLGEPVLRFHHVLIRDAAYRRILKGTRAELHARFADWVEARAPDSVEHDETIGWHLEQAHQHLRELGPIDARGRALGERAAQRLAAAGRRSLARDDVRLASGLLGRALDRLDRDDVARAELALDWCESLLASGDVGPASGALDELDRFAASDPRLRAWHTCFAGQLTTLTAPQGLNAAAEAVAKAATDLSALGDVAGEAKAHFVHAQVHMRLGKVGACEASLDRALAAARRAGDSRRSNTVLAVAPLAALWGPSPVTRASGRCLDVVRVLRITQGAPAVESVALSCQGVLEALRGRTDASRRMIASARKMVEELGITQRLLEADAFAARIDLLNGDAAAAERGLRAAYEGMRELGLGIDAARAAALLARALLALDRAAEAEALTRESEQLAGDDLQAAIAWRGARAEALARRGETVEAVALASKAVEIAAATDALLDHADARLALAAALRAAGRSAEADTEERRATELWVAKGATLLAERARRASPQPAETAVQPEARVEHPRPARLRVRANRATPGGPLFEAAVAARDVAALERLFSDPCVVVHHATGVTFGRREQLASWKSIFRAERVTYRREVLATLGDSLELWRHWLSISGLTEAALAPFGTADFEEIVIGEDEGGGRYRRVEIFPAHRLGDAIARLYERYAELLTAGAARARGETTARSVKVVAPGQFDLDRYADVFLPDLEIVDHRMLGHRTGMDRQALFRSMAAAGEVGDQLLSGPRDVLALTENALLLSWLASGVGRESGGAFEWAFLRLFVFDSDGRVSRYELFDAGREAEALSRFDALGGGVGATTTPERFENAASRSDALLMRRFNERDWPGIEALAAPELVFDERRRMSRNTCGREVWLEQFRLMFDQPASRFTTKLVATRGERLSLSVHHFAAEVADGGGPLEMDDHFALHEVDRQGRIVAIVLFDQHDLDAAHAELDARFAAGEGATQSLAAAWLAGYLRCFAARDWNGMRALYAPDPVGHNHRLVGWGTLHGPAALVSTLETQVGLAPDTLERVDHVRTCERGVLVEYAWQGTREGGQFENVWLVVAELDAHGRARRVDVFEAEQLDAARARLAQVADAEPAADPFANAATRFLDERFQARWHARDWAGFARLLAAEFRFEDRKRLLQLTLDRDGYVAWTRELGDMSRVSNVADVLATRGERLVLKRVRIEVAGGDVGPSDLEHLNLMELDPHGQLVAHVRFDLDDLDAAYAELDRRYEAAEDALLTVHATFMRAFARAIETREWGPVLALCSPALVEHDHRPLAVLGTTRGAEAWVQNFRVLGELAPDSRYRVDHFRSSARGCCTVGVWLGTREGGPYEIPLVAVLELDEHEHMARADIYDADQLEEARARFDELAAPTRVPARFENTATLGVERSTAAQAARDWQSFGAFFSPEFRNYDRRAMVQLEIDREQFLQSYRQIIEITSARPIRDVLATRGDRLALVRVSWQGAEGDVGPTAIEYLLVVEVDTGGETVAAVTFDPGDLDAAYAELDARFAAGEGALHPRASTWVAEFQRAFAARDWPALDAMNAPDRVAQDHRLVGWGTLDGPGGRAPTLEALVSLAADTRLRIHHLRTCERGFLWTASWLGTWEGGAFETQWIMLAELDDLGRQRRMDLWDIEQIDVALERFASLRALNKAADTMAVRWQAAFDVAAATGDWEPMRALCAPDMVFDDRRRLALLTGDRELMIASARERFAMGARPELRVIETAGDRVVVLRMLWSGGPADGRFEIEYLGVVEVDAHGRIQAIVMLDADDVDAAKVEAQTRRAGIGADAPNRDPLRIPPNAAARLRDRVEHLYANGDLAPLRALAADEFSFDDRSRRALLRGGVEEWLNAIQFLVKETGARRETRLVATAGDRLALHHVTWHEAPGAGRFQLDGYRLTEIDTAGKQRALILFDTDDCAEAGAELFERYVANGADGMPRGLIECLRGLNDHDLVRARTGLCDNLVIDDHRRTGLGRVEGAEAYIASLLAAHELSPDLRVDVLYFAAVERHGRVYLARASGTNTVGGAFESFFVELAVFRGEKIARFEIFEPEQLDAALARLEELRSDTT